MAPTLTVGVVPGVSADSWVRVWRERMPQVTLSVVLLRDEEVADALPRRAEMVLARVPVPGLDPAQAHVIALWDETPVVIAAKDHPVKVFDSVTLADLADEQLFPGWEESTLDLVATGSGIARMPQSVFRAIGRRDLVARPISDAEPTKVALVWLRSTTGPLVDEFVGIVRGRTVNSSRGAAVADAPPPKAAPPRPKSTPAKSSRSQRPIRGGRPHRKGR